MGLYPKTPLTLLLDQKSKQKNQEKIIAGLYPARPSGRHHFFRPNALSTFTYYLANY